MLNTHHSLWNEVLLTLQGKMNQQSFNSWLKDTKSYNLNSDVLTIIVPDDIAKEHISKTFDSLIQDSIIELYGKSISCRYLTEIDLTSKDNETNVIEIEKQTKTTALDNGKRIVFNPNYTFETFIIGPNNELAHAAAESISKNPAGQYNPLFIYGDSGLGKTHLLHAIGNAINSEKPFLNILYVTSEQFISEFIQSIQSNTMQSLKIKYRNVDVLMIDDIQFLANKDQTQNEFFHTFNDLHVNKKQIVLTSDRPPRELSLLTDRLRTRFEGGLLADIKAPNLETREAILRKKANIIGLELDDDIIYYLAKRIKSNIRLLESALNKLHAISTIKKMEITQDVVKQYVKPLFEEQKNKELSVDEIIKKVSEKFNASIDSIKSKSRHASIIQPRFISMYLCTQLTHLTTSEIGKEIGNRDHSTVINARNNIQKSIEEDDQFKELIDDIISELKS
jgi:chromosomal replication initiator protein